MRADPRELAAVFAGGVLGALARASVAEALPVTPGSWPWATFLTNVAGAALVGWIVTHLDHLPRSAYHHPFLATGLCGALTTFSAMQIELLDMLDAGSAGLAVLYAGGSVAAGLAAVTVATLLARRRQAVAP